MKDPLHIRRDKGDAILRKMLPPGKEQRSIDIIVEFERVGLSREDFRNSRIAMGAITIARRLPTPGKRGGGLCYYTRAPDDGLIENPCKKRPMIGPKRRPNRSSSQRPKRTTRSVAPRVLRRTLNLSDVAARLREARGL